MDLMNYSTLRTLSRILTADPQGRQVGAVLDKVHSWQTTTPHTNSMLIPTLRYEVYESLKADTAALELRYMVPPALHAARHAAEVLDELREGTGCYQPTWDEETLQTLPEETRERWLDSFERDEDAEDERDRAGAGDDRCDHACGRTGFRGHGSSSPGLVSWCDAFSL